MSSINYLDPITSGLVAAYDFASASVNNIVNNSDSLSISGDAVFDADGLNGPATGLFTGAILTTPPTTFKPVAVTVFWYGKFNGNGLISDNPALAGMFFNNTGTNPFISYGLFRQNPSQNDIFAVYTEGATVHVINLAFAVATYGVPVNYTFTRQTGATAVYKNGTLIGSDAVAGDITYDTTATFQINNHVVNSGNSANTDTNLVFIWNRVLTSGEIASLSATPRLFLVDSDSAGGQTVVEGLINSFTLLATGDAQGDVSFEGSAGNEISGFLADADASLIFEGSVSGQTLTLLGDAQGDISFDGDMTGPIVAAPIECISGDGTYVPPSVGSGGNNAY